MLDASNVMLCYVIRYQVVGVQNTVSVCAVQREVMLLNLQLTYGSDDSHDNGCIISTYITDTNGSISISIADRFH